MALMQIAIIIATIGTTAALSTALTVHFVEAPRRCGPDQDDATARFLQHTPFQSQGAQEWR